VVEATLGHRHSVGVAAVYNRYEFYPEKTTALDVGSVFVTSGFDAAKQRKRDLEAEALADQQVGNVHVLAAAAGLTA
jgi:hypothetical protein